MVQDYGITYAKLLLFGEYGILLGGAALTIPLTRFMAKFDFIDSAPETEIARKSNKVLHGFAEFLEKSKSITSEINVAGFKLDIVDGLYLSSDIPIGYGVGSSGVVCAAIYKAYGKNKQPINNLPDNLLLYKSLFSSMEAFFHGKSSGLDPLACLVGKPLLIRQKEISILHSVYQLKKNWFLVDSGSSRITGLLVEKFLAKCCKSDFKSDFKSNYISVVNTLIDEIKDEKLVKEGSNDTRSMEKYMEAISLMQLRYFNEMIPAFLVPLWQQGIDTGCFYLKLLGAGGGGYYLGISQQKTATEEMVAAYGLKLQWVDV